MRTRTFASWVRPLAEQMRESRRRVLDFAIAQEAPFWDAASVLEGWSNGDLLAHIGGGNDQMLQDLLREVTAGRDVPAVILEPDTDGENARRVAERRSWPVTKVIEEIDAMGEEMQDLLADLRDDHEGLRPGGANWTLGGLFELVQRENHDIEHLEQLEQATRAALRAES